MNEFVLCPKCRVKFIVTGGALTCSTCTPFTKKEVSKMTEKKENVSEEQEIKKIPDSKIIRKLAAEGKSIDEIASETKIRKSYVKYIVNKRAK